MRRGKAIRWHIDRLTEAGHVLGAWTIVGGRECDLVAALAHLPAPIEGFGSSDCDRCRSHLLSWSESERHEASPILQHMMVVSAPALRRQG
jgi:histidyl-tRNA synthetase